MARIPSANPYTFRPQGGEVDPWAAGRPGLNRQQDIIARDRRMPNLIGRVATGAVTAGLGAAAAPLVFGAGAAGAGGGVASGAGAAGVPAAVPAAVAAGRFTLPNILRAAEIGIPAITSLLGQRSQNRALTRQQVIDQQMYADQMRLAEEDRNYRRAEDARVAEEERRRWEIEERNRQKQMAAEDEERAYARRLSEEREGRRSNARMRLNDFLYTGRR